MGRRKTEKLARALARDPCTRLGERHMSRHVLRHLWEEIDELSTSGAKESLRVARLGVRLAGKLTEFCACGRCRRCRRRPAKSEELAQSFARLATALRVAGRLAHAERALAIAFECAPAAAVGCLHRRRVWLRIYQGKLPEAVQDAETAVRLAVGHERALALGALGVALDYSGDPRAAIRKLGECLAGLDPNDEHRYCALLVSYAIVLSKGTREDAVEGLERCAECRSRLKTRHTIQRAKLWWTEGLLYYRLGDSMKAWWALDMARRSLVALKAVPEVMAIIADMARVSPEPLAVHRVCYLAAPLIPRSHPLARPLLDLGGAGAAAIPEAAAHLRAAASDGCPALPPPMELAE